MQNQLSRCPPLSNAGNTQTVRQIKDGTLNSLYIGEDDTPSFIFLVIIVTLSSSSRIFLTSHIYYFMNLQQRICFKGNTTTRMHDNQYLFPPKIYINHNLSWFTTEQQSAPTQRSSRAADSRVNGVFFLIGQSEGKTTF